MDMKTELNKRIQRLENTIRIDQRKSLMTKDETIVLAKKYIAAGADNNKSTPLLSNAQIYRMAQEFLL